MAVTSSIELFVDDAEGSVGVGLVLHDPSIVEDAEGELVVGCKLTPADVRELIRGLEEYADACYGDLE